ncbi:MAG: FtsX-like permease family protein [Dysosmobacter sp.]
MYAGLSVGDTIQFYENGVPTEKCPIIAKAAITNDRSQCEYIWTNYDFRCWYAIDLYAGGTYSKKFIRTPTLYALLFDVEEEYRQDMENYLSQEDDVGYISTRSLRATITSIKNMTLLIGGMIGTVFALVGLINFINLVMTNIITRRHEFATMQSIGMTNQQLRKDGDILKVFSYVLLAGIVGTLAACWILGHNLGKGTGRRSPMQYHDDIPDDPAPGVGYADSVFGIGVYRSRCRTPAL